MIYSELIMLYFYNFYVFMIKVIMAKINIIINKVSKVIEVAFIVSIIVCLSTCYMLHKKEHKIMSTIAVGQVWLYNDDAKNPFNTENPRYRTVLCVEGDYVMYVNVFNDTLSASKGVFIRNSIRVK